MASKATSLADAVTAAIRAAADAGELPMPFAPRRVYVSEHTIGDADNLLVDVVVPQQAESERETRNLFKHIYAVDVVVTKRISLSLNDGHMDSMVELIESIRDLATLNTFTTPVAYLTSKRLSPSYSYDALREHNVFQGTITLEYQVE